MTAVVILLAFVLAGCGGTGTKAQEKAPETETQSHPVVQPIKVIHLDGSHQLVVERLPSGRYLICTETFPYNDKGVAISCDWDGMHSDWYNADGKWK